MVKLSNVSKYYTNNNSTNLGLHNINLELNKGEIVAIVGESGSGKSTLLNVITKMDTFDEGEIYYKGNETSYFGINDMDSFRKNKVGFIFQNYNIIDSYTVLENVMMPYTLNGISSKDAKDKAIELINKVGLEKRIKNRGSQLSGGEKQRCVIARALASNAEILACDEPTGNLDSKSGAEIIKLIKEVASDKLVLIVTHNYDEVKDIATRKIKIHDGEIVEDEVLINNDTIDEDEVLDLDYKPISKKIAFNVSIKNLLKTPKKTILTSLVILFVSLFSISLYQAITYLNENESYQNDFNYRGKEKVLIYDINHKEIDKSFIDDLKNNGIIYDYSINNFYEATQLYGTSLYDNKNFSSIFYYGYEKNPSNLTSKTLSEGRMPSSDNECVLLLPQNFKFNKEYILDEEISLYGSYYYNDSMNLESFKIVGLQYRSDCENPTLTGCEKIEKTFRATATFLGYNNELVLSFYNSESNEADYIYYNASYDPRASKTYFKYNPNQYDLSKVSIHNFYYGPYKILDKIDSIELVEDEELLYSSELVIGNDLVDLIDDNIYEVSVYSSNLLQLANKLEDKNISSLYIKEFNNTTELERFINNLWTYVAIIMSSTTIIILFFISYIILSKIYSSKKKDYTIIRTLGLTKKDMKSIVKDEVFINTTVVSIFVYLLVFILGKTVNNMVFEIFKNITLFTTFMYFLVMILFAYSISKRFNTRLFKYSVNQTLKDEEVKND